MSHEDELRHLAELPLVERTQAEKLFELARANPHDPSYAGFVVALRLGSQPIILSWLQAHASGYPYPSHPLWETAITDLQSALQDEENRERISLGLSTDETDISNEEYFHDLMNRDD